MVMPNFLIIGAAKAGTTAISSYLNQHPQIYMSPVKEPHFFSWMGTSIEFQGPGDRTAHEASILDLNVYENLFQDISDEIAIGEASTSYLYIPEAAPRIKHYIPEVKLIAILRNPVDRAHASFLHLIRDGHETLLDFSEALKAEASRIQDNWMPLWHYKQRGFYYSQLRRYYDLFPAEQIRVYLYDDLSQNVNHLLTDLFQFLGVDDTFSPDMTSRPNASGIPKNKLLHSFLSKNNPVKSILRPLIPAQTRQTIRKNNLEKPTISAEIRAELIDQYRDDILQLQALIERDLSAWLQPSIRPVAVYG